jgi:hypothetical protein
MLLAYYTRIQFACKWINLAPVINVSIEASIVQCTIILVFWLWGRDWRLTGLRLLLWAFCPSLDEDEWRGEWMNYFFEFLEKWSPQWNDYDRGKPKNSEENLS